MKNRFLPPFVSFFSPPACADKQTLSKGKMYKTVRHGENSLQYKILAQQEEGLTNVRCRKPSRAVTLKFLVVVVLLIIGIIASAVLVPLVLTNDFFTLTGTFQKFSVSTLRRTHSGNHVVVIAKKPFGWNAPHASAPPKLPDASQNHLSDAKTVNAATNSPFTNKATSTMRSTFETTTAETTESTTRRTTAKLAGETTPKEETVADAGRREEGPKFRPTPTTEERGRISSTSRLVWFEPVGKWEIRPPEINTWMERGIASNPLYLFVAGCVLFLVVVILMFLVLRKTISGRRTVTEKETAETKEDKARLLKPSARGSDEE